MAATNVLSVSIFNVETGEVQCTVKGHSKDNEECTCKHDAGVFGNGYEANPDCPVSGHSHWVLSVAWSPDGTKLASGSDDDTVRIWEVATGKELSQLSCDPSVRSIDWHDNRIVAGCYDGTIKVFDAQSGDRLSTVTGHTR